MFFSSWLFLVGSAIAQITAKFESCSCSKSSPINCRQKNLEDKINNSTNLLDLEDAITAAHDFMDANDCSMNVTLKVDLDASGLCPPAMAGGWEPDEIYRVTRVGMSVSAGLPYGHIWKVISLRVNGIQSGTCTHDRLSAAKDPTCGNQFDVDVFDVTISNEEKQLTMYPQDVYNAASDPIWLIARCDVSLLPGDATGTLFASTTGEVSTVYSDHATSKAFFAPLLLFLVVFNY